MPPLIRYDTGGDFLFRDHNRPIIDGWHKIKFYLIDKDKRQITLRDIYLCGEAFMKIGYYQFVQEEAGKAKLILELVDRIDRNEKKQT